MKAPYAFYDGTPPHQERDTSYKAAVSVLEDAATLRASVFRYIRKRGRRGATDHEVQRDLNMNPSTQRPRRIELVQKGVVVDSGQRRKTPSNRDAAVWVATEFAPWAA